MVDKEIWCVGTVKFGVDADSIGTKEFATKFFKDKTFTGQIGILGEITRPQAMDIIIEDILEFDKTGLRLGNTVRNLARMKLKERLNLTKRKD